MTGPQPDPTLFAARQLLEQQVMGVVTLDRAGVVTGRHGALVDWVETGLHWSDVLPVLTEHEAALKALADGDLPTLCLPEIGYRGADGRDLSFTVHGFRAPAPAGLALVFQDATRVGKRERSIVQQRDDLELAERRLNRAKDLAAAAKEARSAFLANISHELRTPLNVIIGNAEILRDWDADRLPAEELHTFAEDILENGTFLLDQINDLLDLAQAEAGGIKLVEEELDIGEVIDEVLALVGRQAEARTLSLDHRRHPDLPRLYGDARRLRQVMHTLLCNAIQVSRDGGTVSVRSFPGADGAPMIDVADDEAAIEPQRLDGELQPSGGAQAGTGVGLPLARTLVELHGGTLTLDGAPGQGTRVTLRFPPDRARVDA